MTQKNKDEYCCLRERQLFKSLVGGGLLTYSKQSFLPVIDEIKVVVYRCDIRPGGEHVFRAAGAKGARGWCWHSHQMLLVIGALQVLGPQLVPVARHIQGKRMPVTL